MEMFFVLFMLLWLLCFHQLLKERYRKSNGHEKDFMLCTWSNMLIAILRKRYFHIKQCITLA